MFDVTVKDLLSAGVHFGHQTKRWNPKMKPYIFGEKNGIYIIDLFKTVKMFEQAYKFIADTVANKKSILFVCTKKQARESIYEEANRAEMYYVQNRWLGGMLTNFETIKKAIDRLHYLKKIQNDDTINLFPKNERLGLLKEKDKLEANIGGISNMKDLPGALFVIDVKNEAIAVKEANKLGIPVVAVVDTNCNPDNVDYIIPGNDDAVRAIRLFVSNMADACIEGKARYEAEKQAISNKKATVVVQDKELEKEILKKEPKKDAKEEAGGPVVQKRRRVRKPQEQTTKTEKSE